MKDKFLRVSLLVLGLFFLFSLPGAVAAEKIGFVDVQEILLKSDAGEKASEEFKQVLAKHKSQLQAKEIELKKLKEELERKRSVLKRAALKNKENAYQNKIKSYQLAVKTANEELKARDAKLSKALVPEIMKIAGMIGEKENYSVIFDVGTMPVPYFPRENDLTKRVIDELNRTYRPEK